LTVVLEGEEKKKVSDVSKVSKETKESVNQSKLENKSAKKVREEKNGTKN